MIKIGILAPGNCKKITKTLLDIFKLNHIVVAICENSKDIKNKISFFEKNRIEYVLITFKEHSIHPVDLDVLILDNAYNTSLVTYSLVECVNDKTILIYNTDNGYLPKIEHQNAIDYGFSATSRVTVSSIDYSCQKKSFVIYVQQPLHNPFSEDIPISEIPITPINNQEISSQLPAVVVALLFDIPVCNTINKIKI